LDAFVKKWIADRMSEDELKEMREEVEE